MPANLMDLWNTPKLRYSFDEIVLEGLSKKWAGRNVILEMPRI